ncbi:MAG TPA: tRNA (N6-isopentenyl adenosine(37)-C2)-methylthiotransferase MiaB [Spirochaetales bacterium]|nr:tRNA (N6-isopentenyl adenosine(37)-C2)-methylthiotransferase MiaB [Spirochaetales bacterium]
MRYLIETYGCQMNKAESAALETIFRERGWLPADAAAEADLVLINTCSVRATAENRAWGRIDLYASLKRERAAAKARPLSLVVAGCMAERLKRGLKERQPAVDYVVGTFQKQAFGLALDAVEQALPPAEIEESPAFVFSRSHREPGAFRSFLPIMHGCDNFCSYCIVPYLRGREVSRKPEDILAELEELEDAGVRELTLLGQNVNSYSWKGEGGELDFAGLLRLVSERLRSRGSGGIRWVRFLTSHPKDLSERVIRVLAEDELFCRHVQLCAQSGSDRVLAAMNRRYTSGDYLALVERMKAAIPGLSLSSDILVGFPGETEEDLEATLELMRKVGFAYSFMYHYNPREGTPAAAMEGRVPDRVKRERLARVIELQKRLTREIMESRVGAVDEVLVEGLSRRKKSEVLGRTQRDEMVVFPAPASRVGSFARVRLTGLSGNTFRAEELVP